jgi:hypothetical protein
MLDKLEIGNMERDQEISLFTTFSDLLWNSPAKRSPYFLLLQTAKLHGQNKEQTPRQ